MFFDEKRNQARLLVRGVDESMRKLINFGKGLGRYEQIINFNKQRGYKSFIFASKIIPLD